MELINGLEAVNGQIGLKECKHGQVFKWAESAIQGVAGDWDCFDVDESPPTPLSSCIVSNMTEDTAVVHCNTWAEPTFTMSSHDSGLLTSTMAVHEFTTLQQGEDMDFLLGFFAFVGLVTVVAGAIWLTAKCLDFAANCTAFVDRIKALVERAEASFK